VGIVDAVAHLHRIKVQTGKVARVGGVLEAEVDAVGAMVDGGLEGRQAAGGADEFDALGRFHGLGAKKASQP